MVWRRRVEVVGREGGRACVWEEERRGTISTHTILRRSTGVGHLGTTLNSPGNICEQASSSFEPGNKTNTSPVASPLTLHTSTSHTKHITSSLTPHTTHFHLSHQTHHLVVPPGAEWELGNELLLHTLATELQSPPATYTSC